MATRKMVNVWCIRESGECQFCCAEPESSVHLFWYCHIVSAFWREVQIMCSNVNLHLKLDLFSVILGLLQKQRPIL